MDYSALKECMEFVDQLTDEAGKLMEEGFYGEKQIEQKRGNWDLVTDYDKKVEKLIMDAVRNKYPDHKLLGEESASKEEITKSENESSQQQEAKPLWLIDPIDGTYNYAHGFPASCISIGLAIKGQVVLGVVYDPISKSKYSAIKGHGAFLNGNEIHVSKHKTLKDALVSFEVSLIRVPWHKERNTNRFLAITHMTNGVRILGSAALSLCMVARGGLDMFYHEYLQPWDLAAGSLILVEAGGCVCHTNGETFSTMGKNILAAANKEIIDDTLEVFQMNP